MIYSDHLFLLIHMHVSCSVIRNNVTDKLFQRSLLCGLKSDTSLLY